MFFRKKRNKEVNNYLVEKNVKDKISSLVTEKIINKKYKYKIYKRTEGIYQIFIFKLVYDDEINESYWIEEKNGAEIHLCGSFEKSQKIAEELIHNIGK